jgi:ketosteroid isomerase-like protein
VTTEDRRIELLRTGFEAFERGDMEYALGTLDPEIEVYAPPEVGNTGTFHGHEGFLRWSGIWYEAWDEFNQKLRSVETIGERHVVADVDQTARGRHSGLELKQSATYIYEVRDGKAVYMSITFDPDRAREIAREREAGAEG